MISENDKSNILREWKTMPLAPRPFAAYYMAKGSNASKSEIVAFLEASVEYSTLKRNKDSGIGRSFTDEMIPSSTLFLDSMYIRYGVSGGKFVFVAVDGFTGMVYFRPMRRITGKSAANALEKILVETGRVGQVITDNGTEFMSRPFQKILQQNSIKHVPTTKSFRNKAWKAERAIRTLRQMLGRQRIMGSRQHLPELLRVAQDTINSTPRPYTDVPRNQITAAHGPEMLKKAEDFSFVAKAKKFVIGQAVLLKLPQGPFHKSNHPSFGDTVYLVVGVKPGAPLEGYRLENLNTGERLEGSYSSGLLTLVTHKLHTQRTVQTPAIAKVENFPQRITRSQTKKNVGQ